MENIIPKENRLVKSLSWSKVWSWQKSKKQFVKTYFDKAPFFETKEIIFGSTLWNMIELWEYHNIDMIKDKVMTNFQWEIEIDARKEKMILQWISNIQSNPEFIEKLQEMSFDFWSEMEIKMNSIIDDVYLIWFADNWTSDWKNIKEFKTWKIPWTQDKVDNHWQLDFYCLMTYLTKWYLPDDVELTWFETADDWQNWITITGKIETFKFDVQKHKDRILDWQTKIPKIFDDIQREQLLWEEGKNSIEWENFDDDLFIDLRDIERAKMSLDIESKLIKKQIEIQLIENNLSEYKLDGFGSVSYTTRKKFNYSDEVKEAEKHFKALKKEFENNNEYTETKSLTFRINKGWAL